MKDRDVKELDCGILIFDVPEEKGIEIIFPVFENMRASIFVDDKEAQSIISILQNKINGRF